MTEHVDFSFLDTAPPEPMTAMERFYEINREGLRRKICLSQNDMEEAIERARLLIRGKEIITDELSEMEAFGTSLLLTVALLRSEASKTE